MKLLAFGLYCNISEALQFDSESATAISVYLSSFTSLLQVNASSPDFDGACPNHLWELGWLGRGIWKILNIVSVSQNGFLKLVYQYIVIVL